MPRFQCVQALIGPGLRAAALDTEGQVLVNPDRQAAFTGVPGGHRELHVCLPLQVFKELDAGLVSVRKR